MTVSTKLILILAVVSATTGCVEKKQHGGPLRQMFEACKKITDGSKEKIDPHCYCVAKKLVKSESANDLEKFSKNPTDLLENSKSRDIITSCAARYSE